MTLQAARSDKKKRDEVPQMPKQRPQQSRGDFLWELRPKESPHYSRVNLETSSYRKGPCRAKGPI